MPKDPISGSTTNSLDALCEAARARPNRGRPYEGGRKSDEVLRIRNASASATMTLARIQAAHSCTAAQALDHMAAGYKAAMAVMARRSNMTPHEAIQAGQGISGATTNSPAHVRDLADAAGQETGRGEKPTQGKPRAAQPSPDRTARRAS